MRTETEITTYEIITKAGRDKVHVAVDLGIDADASNKPLPGIAVYGGTVGSELFTRLKSDAEMATALLRKGATLRSVLASLRQPGAEDFCSLVWNRVYEDQAKEEEST